MNSLIKNSVIDTIGNTPLVRLSRLCAGHRGTVLAKLENTNPGLSKKDRIAKHIVMEATKSGALLPGQPVVELTSGNTGTGLAIVCAVMGHPFIAVMSEGNSHERVRMMRALGARVELVPQTASVKNQVSGADLELVEQRAQELVRDLGAFRVDQFHRAGNPDSHEFGTGSEIIQQTDGGQFDAFVDFVGTGGTFAGCMKAFRKHNLKVEGYIVEPECADVLRHKFHKASVLNSICTTDNKHKIQGGGYSMDKLDFVDQSIDEKLVNGFISVSDEEAIETARMLAQEEGILGGFSAGANICAALKLIDRGLATTVVALVCDSGMKYVSTDLYEE